jgi:hypothetical protein
MGRHVAHIGEMGYTLKITVGKAGGKRQHADIDIGAGSSIVL